MKTLIVFDLDGTITKSKSPIDAGMASHLTGLLKVMNVAIISGAGWPQFENQLLAHLPQDEGWSRLSLLPTSGGQFYQFDGQWRQLYSEDFSVPEKVKIIDALNLALDKSGFRETKPWGAIIEDRGGQITLSALGQAAPLNAKMVLGGSNQIGDDPNQRHDTSASVTYVCDPGFELIG